MSDTSGNGSVPELKLTPTEQRIIDLLSDGFYHTSGELLGCLEGADELSRSAVRNHLNRLKRKLRPTGEDICCELAWGRMLYRHIVLLCGPVIDMPIPPK